jgi:tetratricopeptide (TPR) repeat protein
MLSKDSIGKHRTEPAGGGPSAEEARLDEAIKRADRLLVTSLKLDERRRSRRRIVLISLGVLSLGGLVMLTTFCIVFLGLGADRRAAEPSNREEAAHVAAQTGNRLQKEQRVEPVSLALNNGDDAARVAAEGWSLWQKQQFDAAADKFEEAVKLDPRNAGAWNGLGWSSFNGGNYEPAEKAFRKAVSLEPKHPAALNGLGQLALLQRKYDRAEEYLLKAAPQASAAWYGLAKLYLLTGKYDKAAKWAQKIIRSGEADPAITQWLEAAKKKILPADLRRSIEPNPNATQVVRGWQLANQGRHEEAKAVFEAALAKDPKDAAALNGMGWCLLGSGKTDEAKPYFERALAADPLAAGAMNGLARVLSAEGDVEGAIKIWQKMVEKIPGPHAGTSGLADAYLQKGDDRKALPLLEQLAKAHPDDEQIKKKLDRARAGNSK